jgi:hypothetical protein
MRKNRTKSKDLSMQQSFSINLIQYFHLLCVNWGPGTWDTLAREAGSLSSRDELEIFYQTWSHCSLPFSTHKLTASYTPVVISSRGTHYTPWVSFQVQKVLVFLENSKTSTSSSTADISLHLQIQVSKKDDMLLFSIQHPPSSCQAHGIFNLRHSWALSLTV